MLRRHEQSPKRCTGDAGTSLVELALIITPLCMVLFGIVVYGYLMSFRQNMTQAAAEGARAGAVAPADDPAGTYNNATDAALFATDQALRSFGKTCGTNGYGCSATVNNCAGSTSPCITVTVTYDYNHYPLMPNVPIVSNFIPGTFTSTFTTQVNQ